MDTHNALLWPLDRSDSAMPLRIGWIGFHSEGLMPLRAVLEQGASIQAVITLDPRLAARRSGAADYGPLCREFGVPLFEVPDINDARSLALLAELSLDVAFVIGWTQIVGRDAMAQVRRGLIGAHASLLPSLRGRAPINWALIRGLTHTGNSLLWLTEELDRGPLIDQTAIPITPYDTCASLYARVAESNTQMILRALPRLLNGELTGNPQPAGDEANLPARRPEDGTIDWSRSSREIYDFIRALTRPYPGAWSWLGGQRYRIWQSALLPGRRPRESRPGQALGPVVSPVPQACGQVVACGSGNLLLLEVETDAGLVLTGPALSERCPTGKMWSREH